MFFNDVFDQRISIDLPAEVTFVVEHTITQILTNCEIDFLKKSIIEKNLARPLFDELVFYGPIAKPYLSKVEIYLNQQEPALIRAAELLLKEPDNEVLRDRLSSPSLVPQASFSR